MDRMPDYSEMPFTAAKGAAFEPIGNVFTARSEIDGPSPRSFMFLIPHAIVGLVGCLMLTKIDTSGSEPAFATELASRLVYLQIAAMLPQYLKPAGSATSNVVAPFVHAENRCMLRL